jgi:DNA-directed RNA polymerase
MRNKLLNSLKERLEIEISPRNPIKFLKELALDDLLDAGITVVYMYTRNTRSATKDPLMSEICTAIGHLLRGRFKMKKDSALAAKTGAFILFTFEAYGIITTKMGSAGNGHGTYIVSLTNEELITKLWETIPVDKVEKLPSLAPYADWHTSHHSTGALLVKTANREVLSKLTSNTHPIVFETVNRAQRIGWMINEEIYTLVGWALRNKVDAFADIWELQNAEAKQSKLREAKSVASIAKRFIGQIFYHLYYLDFRGRKYPATAYLHEQGSDLAKGLLLRADSAPIGKGGFDWLLISIASNWAGDAGRADGYKTDKIPLIDRIKWAIDNEEIFLDYAENPKVNQGWMKADKPWQFLATCMELAKFRVWQVTHASEIENGELDEYGYESHLECYIDGSNNGSQHLSALTRDEITAPHVNLVPLDLPGDLYKYVADHVWEKISKEVSKMPVSDILDCEKVIKTLTEMKKAVSEAPPRSEIRKELVEVLLAFKKENEHLITKAAPIFWSRITDHKHRRKVCKRNVMTLPYGGTPYGLGQQQIDDARKHGIESLMTMEHRWGSYMGREVFEACKESLARPMRLLGIFESAGKQAEKEDRFLSWEVPITKFPVVQHYTEGTVRKIYVQYGPPQGERKSTGYYENTYQLNICFLEDQVLSKHKQAQGASPNAIHSLDAAHLMLTVYRADFPVTTIHDSFGCLLSHMPRLFPLIRETFVEFYLSDPLTTLMQQIGGNIDAVELGSLDIHAVIESEYCFA